jgi:hypothetical protein
MTTSTSTKARVWTAPAVAVVLVGCWQSYQEVAEGEEDRHAWADAMHEGDTDGWIDTEVVHDVEAGVDARDEADLARDADGEAEIEADDDHGDDADGGCDGAWQDPTTGYLWEIPPPYLWMNCIPSPYPVARTTARAAHARARCHA